MNKQYNQHRIQQHQHPRLRCSSKRTMANPQNTRKNITAVEESRGSIPSAGSNSLRQRTKNPARKIIRKILIQVCGINIPGQEQRAAIALAPDKNCP